MRKRIPALVAGLLVGATVIGGTAYAITSSSFTYSSTKTGYLSISTMDFAPDGLWTATEDYFNGWGGSNLSNTNSSRCFNAGVNLPNGSRIKSIRFFYTSDATGDFFGRLVRVNPATGGTKYLATVSPADDTGVRTSVNATVPANQQLVKNGNFQFGVGACPFDGTVFHGARITYTYRSAGD